MKRIPLFVACSLLVFGTAAMAQNKVDTKWHCPKPSAAYKLDVGDVPDHSYWIGQGTCNATATGSSFPEKTVSIRNSKRYGKHPSASMSAGTQRWTMETRSTTRVKDPCPPTSRNLSPANGRFRAVPENTRASKVPGPAPINSTQTARLTLQAPARIRWASKPEDELKPGANIAITHTLRRNPFCQK